MLRAQQAGVVTWRSEGSLRPAALCPPVQSSWAPGGTSPWRGCTARGNPASLTPMSPTVFTRGQSQLTVHSPSRWGSLGLGLSLWQGPAPGASAADVPCPPRTCAAAASPSPAGSPETQSHERPAITHTSDTPQLPSGKSPPAPAQRGRERCPGTAPLEEA